MAHPVEEIIRRASAENWCCEPYCTTCGCMQFRTAIRDLPREVVDEFFRRQPDPATAGLPNYNRYLHLILFHQLPRTPEEQAEARAQTRRAFEEMERRDAQPRAAAHEQRLVRLAEKRRVAAEKHRRRQEESARRKLFRCEILSMPLTQRLHVMLENSGLSPEFFGFRPEDMKDEQIALIELPDRVALAQRISIMRQKRWRELRTRLLGAI